MKSVEEKATLLFTTFMENHWKPSYGVRDNCGPAALDLMDFFKENGINSKRVRGEFLCDIPIHAKKDFSKEMIDEFNKSGLDFNNKIDRLNWITESTYYEEWKKCPHYWVVVESLIFDPSGDAQFVSSGLSSDTNLDRYIELDSD